MHRIEKGSTTEHSKKIKSLENQIEDLKKQNQVLKEILLSKLDSFIHSFIHNLYFVPMFSFYKTNLNRQKRKKNRQNAINI